MRSENIRGVDALQNPTLIVEVLSPTSERRDREAKFTAYKVIPTFREYLLVAQQEPHVTFYRLLDNGEWVGEEISGLDKVMQIVSIDGAIALADILPEC